MGNQPSKKSKETSAESYTTELRSYEEACKEDTELQSFDSCLQARTNKVMSTLATDVEVRSLSFDSLKEVTGCLMEMNQDVVKMILNYKEEIWMHTQLFELVRDYLETSKKTLGFCATLKKCLDLAMGSHTMIINALKHFENESFDQGKTFISSSLFSYPLVLIRDAANLSSINLEHDYGCLFEVMTRQNLSRSSNETKMRQTKMIPQ